MGAPFRMNRQDSKQLALRLREAYQIRKTRLQRRVLAVRIVLLIAFFALWEIAGQLKWIDVLLFSYPSKIARLIWDQLIDGTLLPHIGTTVLETFVGFVLGTALGTAAAAVLWWSPFLARVLDPFIVVLNSMPKVALGPLFIVSFGAGFAAIVATTLSVTVIITMLHIYGSFKQTDPNFVKVVRVFGGSRWNIFAKAVLPSSIPAIVSTLKVNVGLAWVGVIVGEFLVSQQGLGYLIVYGFQVFNFTLVLAGLFIIAAVATLMYQAVAYIEKKMLSNR